MRSGFVELSPLDCSPTKSRRYFYSNFKVLLSHFQNFRNDFTFVNKTKSPNSIEILNKLSNYLTDKNLDIISPSCSEISSTEEETFL
jgi:hypothetical protein